MPDSAKTLAILLELNYHLTMNTQHAAKVMDDRQATITFEGLSIYFIGIGGCGMSGLARLIRNQGAAISGSDNVPNDLTDKLIADGISVETDQSQPHLPAACDLVIATAAIADDHPQLVAANARNIPIMRYAEALGHLQAHHTGISIAGTHGKSTTTAILGHILITAGLGPSVLLGATCEQIGQGNGGCRIGKADVPFGPCESQPGFLIAEACEFNRSFHHHRPRIGLINNLEADHLDVYGSLDAVIDSFATFASLLPTAADGGQLLIAHDGAHREHVTTATDAGVATFGSSTAADYHISTDEGCRNMTITQRDDLPAFVQRPAELPLRITFKLPMPGQHNAMNAAAAAILAHWCGANDDCINKAMVRFAGIDRRLQNIGTVAVGNGCVTLYDDYGHHPTEIRKTLTALREYEQPQRLICVFQPHQHSRTRLLFDDFADSFGKADHVIIPPIYFVRDPETEKSKVSATDLATAIAETGIDARPAESLTVAESLVRERWQPGDLVLILGAGPVWKVGRALLA